MKIRDLLEFGKSNLIEKDEPYRIAKMLLKHILNVDDMYIIINLDTELDEHTISKYKENIKEIKGGEPIQYIINKQEFMNLEFYVDENVLIPQPDTEILVEEVINIANKEKKIKVLDLCTGSGAIGISIANNIKNSKVIMSDISKKALEIAKKNAVDNNVIEKCEFILSNMFENINEKFDIIVSNPPYIKKKVIESLSEEVKNEPLIALDGGEDGLYFYKIIEENAYNYLEKGGILALEIGYDQRKDVENLFNKKQKYKQMKCKKDLSGNDRVMIFFNEK